MRQEKSPTLKEKMFPIMVLEKLASSEDPMTTESFLEEFDKTNNMVVRVALRDPTKWKIESVNLRLRQMKFRGLVEKNGDHWKITPLGVNKLQQRNKRIYNT